MHKVKTTVLCLLLASSPTIHSLSLWHLLAPMQHLLSHLLHTLTLKVNTGCLLLTWYKCCHTVVLEAIKDEGKQTLTD